MPWPSFGSKYSRCAEFVRAFSQHQAVLVHHAVVAVDIGVGVGSFGNFPQRLRPLFPRIIIGVRTLRRDKARILITFVFRQLVPCDGAGIDGTHAPLGVVLRGHIDDVRVAGERVVGMGDIDDAFGGRALRHDRRGAGLGAGCGDAKNAYRSGNQK